MRASKRKNTSSQTQILWLVCIIIFVMFSSSCTVQVKPTSINERYADAQKNLSLLFCQQPQRYLRMGFYEALSRGLKYNLDYRIKLANNALQLDQFKLATFAMFPSLNVSGSLYTRSNDLSSFGTTTTGQITDVLNSTPRTLRSARIALSWNLLDFGVSYVRAKQQGNRYLIAEEEARKQLQQLTQDILTAYWDAYSAQRLIETTKEFDRQLQNAKAQITIAMHDKIIPKENLLNYQEALLEGNRRMVQLKYKYDKAMYDLKHLINLPMYLKVVLEKPPSVLRRTQNLSNLDFQKLDALTLVQRPELSGQNYQKRIAEWGTTAAILQSLPGVTLNEGIWNYNSNKFLINRVWRDKSIDLAWNLLNIASLPTSYSSAEAQIHYEKLKGLALTLTVLTETRYAYSHYQNLLLEYNIARAQSANAQALYRLASNREQAFLASHQQVLLARIRMLAARMDEELVLSDLSTAFGELYLSAGFDMLPIYAINEPLPVIVRTIKRNFDLLDTTDFKAYVYRTYAKLFHNKLLVSHK